MQHRRLGKLEVGAIGLGCMSMTPIYGTPSEPEAIATVHRAIELGADLIDTSDAYGNGANEELVGRALRGRRRDAFVATKFGFVRDAANPNARVIDARPERVRSTCEASLKRLGIEQIDLYYLHRVDPNVPIEDTVGAMAQLVRAGKVRYLGLSEAGPGSIRRAHATHPISSLQSEYSLWTRDMEADVLPTCRSLGIGFVAYSPLGRGFLTGRFRKPDDLAADDYRHAHPRFTPGNFEKNLGLLGRVEAIAREKQCTPAQLALAWLLARGRDVVPIPGTKRRKYLEENAGAVAVALTTEEIARIDAAVPVGATAGPRYPERAMAAVRDA